MLPRALAVHVVAGFAGKKAKVWQISWTPGPPMSTTLKATISVLALACSLRAAPIAYGEVSLLVRMHEADTFVSEQASQRGLLRGFTPQQEARLKAQGASDRLLQALRNPDLILPESEAVAFEAARREQERKATQEAPAAPLLAATPATVAPVADFPFEAGYYTYPAGFYSYGYGHLQSRAHGFGKTIPASRKFSSFANNSTHR